MNLEYKCKCVRSKYLIKKSEKQAKKGNLKIKANSTHAEILSRASAVILAALVLIS